MSGLACDVTLRSGLACDVTLRRADFTLQAALHLPEGGITAVVGPSGCGKSTLLKIIAGLEPLATGVIRFRGVPWLEGTHALPTRRRRVGMMFQEDLLFPHLTLAGNVAFGLPRPRRHEAMHWLRECGLEELAQRKPDQLSGGQRQRGALARALAPGAELLLLDEPFSAVDRPLRQGLRELVRRQTRRHGITTLLVTHDLEDVRQLADRVVVLDRGRLIRAGATAQVLARPRSYRAARILGWDNLLPVQRVEARELAGPWGRVTLDRAADPATRWLAIRPEGIALTALHTPGSLAATVERLLPAALGQELHCRLGDDTPLRLLRAFPGDCPAPGEQVGLRLPPEAIQPLGDSLPVIDPDPGALLPATPITQAA